jgi:hydroxypyruvate isomerase
MQRRKFLGTSAAASVGLLATSTLYAKEQKITATIKLKHNINHSARYWCYNSIALEDFLKNLNDLDMQAIDLVEPEDWPLLKKYNIHASMCWGAEISLTEGWSDPQHHEILIKIY